MKKILLTSVVLCTFIILLAHDDTGGPAGRCNDPANGRQTCASFGCHPTLVTASWGDITSNVPGTGYVPGNTYTIIATVTRANHSKFGFEVSPQKLSGVAGGTLAAVNGEVQIKDSLANHYATQTSTGLTGTGSRSWTFNWVAPAAGTGMVRFFGAFNVTNNNNNRSLDTCVLDSLDVSENTTSALAEIVKDDNIFSVYPNPVADNLTVHCVVQEHNYVQVALYDIQNRISDVLYSGEVHPGIFENTFEIKRKYLPGIYLLKTTMGDKAWVKKVVVQ